MLPLGPTAASPYKEGSSVSFSTYFWSSHTCKVVYSSYPPSSHYSASPRKYPATPEPLFLKESALKYDHSACTLQSSVAIERSEISPAPSYDHARFQKSCRQRRIQDRNGHFHRLADDESSTTKVRHQHARHNGRRRRQSRHPPAAPHPPSHG